jgi:rhodanese-related sulfurtransferase
MDLTQQEWSAQQAASKDSIILDVRTSVEGVSELDVSKTYFVYCRSGARSTQACQIFKQHGMSSCFNLLGGIMEWQGEKTK